jgi:hypothetical protein
LLISEFCCKPNCRESSKNHSLPNLKKTGHKRTNNFTLIEDEKIYSAYLNVSKDLIVGVNQTMQCYSARIAEFYNENKKTANSRTSSSLQHRWSDIQKETSRFCGFYAKIKRRNQSGKSKDDKVNFATTTSHVYYDCNSEAHILSHFISD